MKPYDWTAADDDAAWLEIKGDRAMGEHYTLSDERAEAIARAAATTVTQVREIALADWNEGDEHQHWLDTAPVKEIADWVSAQEQEQE